MPSKGVKKGGIAKRPVPVKKQSVGKVVDARLKLIQKNRKQIRDAREKITETHRSLIKDARELLSSKKKLPPVALKRAVKPKIPRSRAGHLTMDEDMLVDDDDMELIELDAFKTKPLGSLKRTVKNDIFRPRAVVTPPRMPKLPTFSIANREPSPLDDIDPFDVYTVPTRRIIPPPPLPGRAERFHPARGLMSAHMDEYMPRKGILRTSGSDHDDRFDSDRYISSEPRSSRLTVGESAGIFANSSRRPSPPAIQLGTRVIVANLDSSISASDIAELFEDLGPLVSHRIISPGIAEVVYADQGDAERAVETYHNRQLDKRPMKVHIAHKNDPVYNRYRM